MPATWPAYLELYESGELERRTREAVASLESCQVCPRDCKVNRLKNETRVCNTGRLARVSSYFPHRGEEDCLRGSRGSGTIFFSFCNLKCVFCQNWDASQAGHGDEVSAAELAGMMLDLQRVGCHNINFVTPEHVVPQMLEGLLLAIEGGLRLPIVYNTSSYDSLDSLRLVDGVVDIYLPDFKLWSKDAAKRYLKAKDYRPVACEALREMHRQVGDLVIGDDGIARRGVLVRHLVMPGLLDESRDVFRFLHEVSPEIYVNVMGQFRPEHETEKYPEIDRRPHPDEMIAAYRLFREAGLTRLDERAVRLPGIL